MCCLCTQCCSGVSIAQFFEICFMYRRIYQKHSLPFMSSGANMFSCRQLDSNFQTCFRARFQEHVHILSINTSILLTKCQENKVQQIVKTDNGNSTYVQIQLIYMWIKMEGTKQLLSAGPNPNMDVNTEHCKSLYIHVFLRDAHYAFRKLATSSQT